VASVIRLARILNACADVRQGNGRAGYQGGAWINHCSLDSGAVILCCGRELE
jgi:hypothetical protein